MVLDVMSNNITAVVSMADVTNLWWEQTTANTFESTPGHVLSLTNSWLWMRQLKSRGEEKSWTELSNSSGQVRNHH